VFLSGERMKIYVEYEKDITEWETISIDIPKAFSVDVDANLDKNGQELFKDQKEKWMKRLLDNLKNNNVRNINILENKVTYEQLITDYREELEIIEIKTVEELIEKYEEIGAHSFFKDTDDHGRWKISSIY
jgi:aromatic ring-opening dioxygenase LigB subunit